MRPLYLRMHAFGPYHDKVVLDFEALQGHSLFLIYGPTGAGKTTVLDAMVFALYGKTSGDMRSGEMMRSDYALPTLKTEVEFVFSIGRERYKIWRMPKQELQAKRGSGTRVYSSEVEVYHWDSTTEAWALLTKSSSEADSLVQQWVGFRIEQFRQLVLLPQGEFRKVLQAKSNDRGEMLSELFATQLYEAFQKRLKEKAETYRSLCAAEVEEETRLLAEMDVPTYSELVAKEEQARKVYECAEQAQKDFQKTMGLWQTKYREKEHQWQVLTRWKTASQEQETLVTKQDDMEALAAQIKALTTYEKIKPLWTTLQQTIQERAHSEERYEKLRVQELYEKAKEDAWSQQYAEFSEKLGQEERLRTTLQTCVETQMQWEAWQKLVQSIQDEAASLVAAEAVWHKCRCEVEQATMQKEKMEQTLQHLRASIKAKAEVPVALLLCEQQEKAWLQWQERQERLLASQQTYARDFEAWKKKAKQVTTLGSVWRGLATLFVQQQAYHMGKSLQPGEACPVCGATEHPHLATIPKNQVSEEEVTKAREQYEAAEKVSGQEEGRLLLAEKHLKEEAQQLELEATQYRSTLAELGREKERLTAENNQLQAMKEKAEQAEQALPILITTWESAVENERKAKDRHTEVAARHTIQVQQEEQARKVHDFSKLDIVSLRKEIADYRAQLAALDEAKQTLQAQKEDLVAEQSILQGRLQTESVQYRHSLVREQESREQFVEALKASGFTGQDWQRLEKELPQLPLWQEHWDSYHEKFVAVNRLVADARQEMASMAMTPDTVIRLALWRQHDSDYQAKATLLATECTKMHLQYETIRKAKDRCQAIRKSQEDKQQAFSLAQTMADLANGEGKGLRRFTFKNFVLRSILEEVIIAANMRLYRMSRHRYRLEKAPLSTTSRGMQGLDLVVFDMYTGVSRPVQTLSGGETFLASLALALGMADIVQSYAGGTPLEAMFIDEGFGTLDEDTLEVAMSALGTLQASGRLIGIISHVPSLQNRIEARLKVTKTEKGSTASFEVFS